jgi:hypothetical protein
VGVIDGVREGDGLREGDRDEEGVGDNEASRTLKFKINNINNKEIDRAIASQSSNNYRRLSVSDNWGGGVEKLPPMMR